MTPISRNADLYLPVRPGTDLALFLGMLHVILRDGLEDRRFIDEHTVGFDAVAEAHEAYDPAAVGRTSRAFRRKPSRSAAHWFATGAERDRACTPAVSSTTPRASRMCSR